MQAMCSAGTAAQNKALTAILPEVLLSTRTPGLELSRHILSWNATELLVCCCLGRCSRGHLSPDQNESGHQARDA